MARRRMIARGAGTVGGVASTVVVGILAAGINSNIKRNNEYKNASKERRLEMDKEDKDATKFMLWFFFWTGIISVILGFIWGWY